MLNPHNAAAVQQQTQGNSASVRLGIVSQRLIDNRLTTEEVGKQKMHGMIIYSLVELSGAVRSAVPDGVGMRAIIRVTESKCQVIMTVLYT